MELVKALVEYLEKLGTSHVFGVGGASIEPLFHELHWRTKIKPVLAKHEASAVTMAEGYFRQTGKMGVVMVTSGGGAFHTLAPLTEALASGVPLLVIVGQIPRVLEGRGGFQDSSGQATPIEAVAIFKPETVATRRLNHAEELGETLDFLITIALNKRGPCALLINRDLFTHELSSVPQPQLGTWQLTSAAIDNLAPAITAIKRARRPLIIGGKGIAFEGYRQQFYEFVLLTEAKVALTADAKGLWDHCDRAFVGLVGVMGNPSAQAALDLADVIIVVGTALPMMSRPKFQQGEAKTLVSLHRLPTLLGSEEVTGLTVIDVVGQTQHNLAYFCAELSDSVMTTPKDFPPISLDFLNPNPTGETGRSGTIKMRFAIDSLSAMYADDTDTFVDAGNVGAAAIHYFKPRGEALFSVALGMGAMGHSFGCAIGSCIASGRRSLVIAGDGAFFMYGMEIHTAWQYNLPITFVLFNNNAHGMCHVREEVFLGVKTGDNLFKTSCLGAGIAAMMPGLPAFDVSEASALLEALVTIKRLDGPAVLALSIDPDEMPPFQSFLTHKPTERSQTCPTQIKPTST